MQKKQWLSNDYIQKLIGCSVDNHSSYSFQLNIWSLQLSKISFSANATESTLTVTYRYSEYPIGTTTNATGLQGVVKTSSNIVVSKTFRFHTFLDLTNFDEKLVTTDVVNKDPNAPVTVYIAIPHRKNDAPVVKEFHL